MTEEEYFRTNYPDSCYGDRPLSPHWDFFQDGVEFGERQSEEKIEELKNLVSAMLYEINALWDISEMNEDVRKHAERVDSEVKK